MDSTTKHFAILMVSLWATHFCFELKLNIACISASNFKFNYMERRLQDWSLNFF